MDRENLIVRQAVIKAAASAISAGTVGIPQDEIAARTVAIAEYFLEWVYQDASNPLIASNVVPIQNQTQSAPQTPQNVSNDVPSVCPQCGCKVRDNRVKNITRRQEGKQEMPDFACQGKWKREANGTYTQIQKECGWVVWPQTQNA